MWRNIILARIVGLLAALVLAVFLWVGHAPEADAKPRTYRGGLVIDIKKNAMAVKCKKKGQPFRTVKVYYICPRKGYFAYMRVGESFDPNDVAYWKFYRTKKKALRASSRSAQNKYLPTVEKRGGEWVTTKRWY